MASHGKSTLVMGTRGSALALAQSRQVAAALQAAHPGLTIEERVIRTTGDKMQRAPLPVIGGKGVFTLEIEQVLLQRGIDFAVHSLKDLPPQLPEGLCIAAIPLRESASDSCILNPHSHDDSEEVKRQLAFLNAGERVHWDAKQAKKWLDTLAFLPTGARVGTSSLRRRAQLLHLRPDLRIEDMRGNIDTRLRKLEEQNLHAIVLARAGIHRLGLDVRDEPLDERDFVPAPGQGALAIEARADDEAVATILQVIDDAATRAEITAERAVVHALNAGCATPLGARAVVEENTLRLWAVVLSPDGQQRIFAEGEGEVSRAEAIGAGVASQLMPGL